MLRVHKQKGLDENKGKRGERHMQLTILVSSGDGVLVLEAVKGVRCDESCFLIVR